MNPISQPKHSNPGVIFSIILVLLIIVGGAWWFMSMHKTSSSTNVISTTGTTKLLETAPQGTTFSTIPAELIPVKDATITKSEHVLSISKDGTFDIWTVDFTAPEPMSALFPIYLNNILLEKNGYLITQVQSANGVGSIGAITNTATVSITVQNTSPTKIEVSYKKPSK